MQKEIYVSHGNLSGGRTDLDAIASLAVLVRRAILNNFRRGSSYDIEMILYFEHGLYPLLKHYDCRIFISDIPPSFFVQDEDEVYAFEKLEDLFIKLKQQKNEIIYIDHHPNFKNVYYFWKDLKKRKLIKDLYINPLNYEEDSNQEDNKKVSATNMLIEYLEKHSLIHEDDIFKKLKKYADDQDTGIRKISSATNISIIIGADYSSERLIYNLANGVFWTDEWEEIKNQTEYRTRKLCEQMSIYTKNFNGYRIGFALMPVVGNLKVTPAALYLFENNNIDVAILLQKYSFLSIRVKKGIKGIHAGKIASLFGGGGHAGAAAASKKYTNKKFPYDYINKNNFRDIANIIIDSISNDYMKNENQNI